MDLEKLLASLNNQKLKMTKYNYTTLQNVPVDNITDPAFFENLEENKSQCEWFDSNQAAAYLKISVGSLRNMTSNGQMPFYKLGKRNRFLRADLDKILLSQKRGGFYGY